MANIHEESKGLNNLLEQMKELDKEVKVEPQACSLEDDECLTCGS